jgi:aflatoxin B1 aldehyde reductase
MRWCKHHSILDAEVGDGIIFGASSTSHAQHNIAAYGAGPLPDSIVEAMDAAWEVARPDTESYFRGYGAVPGGIEQMLAAPQARI